MQSAVRRKSYGSVTVFSLDEGPSSRPSLGGSSRSGSDRR